MRLKLLLVILGIMLIAVYGTLAVLILAFSDRGAPESTPQEEGSELASTATAMNAYPAALSEAQNWQTDAQLVSVTASWANVSSETDLIEEAPWGFTFFSPQTRLVAVVSVSAHGAAVAQTSSATAKTRPFEPAAWQVDSTDVLKLFLNNGGRAFVTEHPGATVSLRGGLEESGARLVWYAIGLHSGDRATLVVAIDATSGDVLSVTP